MNTKKSLGILALALTVGVTALYAASTVKLTKDWQIVNDTDLSGSTNANFNLRGSNIYSIIDAHVGTPASTNGFLKTNDVIAATGIAVIQNNNGTITLSNTATGGGTNLSVTLSIGNDATGQSATNFGYLNVTNAINAFIDANTIPGMSAAFRLTNGLIGGRFIIGNGVFGLDDTVAYGFQMFPGNHSIALGNASVGTTNLGSLYNASYFTNIGKGYFYSANDSQLSIDCADNNSCDYLYYNGGVKQWDMYGDKTTWILNAPDTTPLILVNSNHGIQFNGSFTNTSPTTLIGTFRIPSGASAGYVLTSDGSGFGTWAAASAGSQSLSNVLSVGNDAGAIAISNTFRVAGAGAGKTNFLDFKTGLMRLDDGSGTLQTTLDWGNYQLIYPNSVISLDWKNQVFTNANWQAKITTNNANFQFDLSSFSALDTFYTNNNHRGFIKFTAQLAGGLTANGAIQLLTISGATTNVMDEASISGVAITSTNSVSSFLNPSQIFLITNVSAGGGTATAVRGSLAGM